MMTRVSSWTKAAELVAKARWEWGRITNDLDEETRELIRRNSHNRRVEALAKLGDNPHPDELLKLGVPKREVLPGYCDECKEYPEELVKFNWPDDSEDTAQMCLKCLLKAVMLLDT